MPKSAVPTSPGGRQARRHNPLSDDLLSTGLLKTKSSKKSREKPEVEEQSYIESKASRRILRIGQDLVEEDQAGQAVKPAITAFNFESRFGGEEDDEPAARDPQYNDEDEGAWGDDGDEMVEEVEIDPADLDMFNRFMPTGEEPSLELRLHSPQDKDQQGTNLADLILEKIAAHEAAQSGERHVIGGGLPEDAIEMPAKVVEVYTKIGLLLSRYKSGRLPKPFKIIPTLPNWEDILYITRPDSWTPNACFEATRLFVAGKPIMTQRFLELFILERVRDDIRETKKLNVHLYKSLKKALYKPAAFFKGFLFPLVGSGLCTLREAAIISSVLVRVSIPVLHSAAALLRLCDIAAEQSSVSTESSGATNIFIRVLLEKKYALPYKVIDALVFHFLRFRSVDPAMMDRQDASGQMTGDLIEGGKDFKLPVLWHQCLLAFAQRYRNEITEDQREALLDLLLTKGHSAIGPEVRRELLEGRGRGVVVEGAGSMMDGGDDTMVMIDPV